jgi:F-box domain
MLSSLPPEILLVVLDHLPAEPLLSLRSTCKALLYIITPQLFSSVHLCPMKSPPRDREQKCLQSLESPYSTIAPYVRGLYIGSQRATGFYELKDASKLIVRTVLADEHITPCIARLRNLKAVQ